MTKDILKDIPAVAKCLQQAGKFRVLADVALDERLRRSLLRRACDLERLAEAL